MTQKFILILSFSDLGVKEPPLGFYNRLLHSFGCNRSSGSIFRKNIIIRKLMDLYEPVKLFFGLE